MVSFKGFPGRLCVSYHPWTMVDRAQRGRAAPGLAVPPGAGGHLTQYQDEFSVLNRNDAGKGTLAA